MTEYLYDILEIDKSATVEEIRNAYRKLALKHHPDKNKSENSVKQFQKIKYAYDILHDPIKRSIYDVQYESNSHKNMSPIDWNCFINLIIKSMKTIFKKHIIPSDVVVVLQTDLESIYNKKIKKINVKVNRLVEDALVVENEIVYIDLVNYKTEYVFKKKGDSSVLSQIPNSNLIVKLDIASSKNVMISDIFSPYDLTINVTCSLYEFYMYDYFVVDEIPGLEIKNQKKQSFMIPEYGLPYICETTGEEKRGDIYVKCDIKLPCYHKKEIDDAFFETLSIYFK